MNITVTVFCPHPTDDPHDTRLVKMPHDTTTDRLFCPECDKLVVLDISIPEV